MGFFDFFRKIVGNDKETEIYKHPNRKGKGSIEQHSINKLNKGMDTFSTISPRIIFLQKENEREKEDNRRSIEEKNINTHETEEQKLIYQQQSEKEHRERESDEQVARVETNISEENARLRHTVTQQKINSGAFLHHLKINGVRYFYHFTDVENINSIKRFGGLFSWYYCSQHDIHIPNAGGNDSSRALDCKYGLQDYVRLSFCQDHPMAYRKHKEGAILVLLKIKIEVATFKNTIFSDMNATDSKHTHGDSLHHLQRIDIKATQASFVSREHSYFQTHQAECMVKTFIPIEYIVNINNPNRMVF